MIELCGWGLHSHTEPLIGLPRSHAPCNSQVSQRVKEISLTWPPLGSLRVPRPHQGRQSTLTPLHRGQGTCSTAVSPCLQARLPFHHPNLLSSRAEWEHGSRKRATELLLQGERKHLGLQENVHTSRRAQTQQPFLTTHVFPQISHHHSCSPTLLSPQTRSALDCKHVTAACAGGGS